MEPTTSFVGTLSAVDARAVFRVNSVPIWESDGRGGGNQSSSGPLNPWMVEGQNVIEVEVSDAGPNASVEAQAGVHNATDPFAPLEQRYAWGPDAPRGRLTLRAQTMPRWSWRDAEPWKGRDDEILALLKDVRRAIEQKDAKAMHGWVESRLRDVQILYGPMDPDFVEASVQEYLQAVPELKTPLRIERFHDGRVVRASGADGGEPLVVKGDDGEAVTMMGRWWTRIVGRWQILS
jgi:hypothetical protein